MSHTAIAAVLARTDLSIGERLAALSLASFADREQRAFPGNAAAAARAGLGRSRYLEARGQLVSRGLVAIESAGRGRGQATTVIVLFARCGPWWEGGINARLLEHVLGHSPARGPARLLLAALAAVSDEWGGVDGLSTDDLCAAAGLANSTYRRARRALLTSGEVELIDDGGGRGRMNRWRVVAAGALSAAPGQSRRRRAPAAGQPPLLAPMRTEPAAIAASQRRVAAVPARAEKGPDLSGVTGRKGPILSWVSPPKRPGVSGVSVTKPAEIPPETQPANARAGTNPLNPVIANPPNPPEGGSSDRWAVIEELFVSDRGRRRQRQVRVDLDEVRRRLDPPRTEDLRIWQQIRDRLRQRAGEPMFDVWLEPIELVAVDGDQRLVLLAPAATAGWTSTRFGRILASISTEFDRNFRFANESERHALGAIAPGDLFPIDHKEAAG